MNYFYFYIIFSQLLDFFSSSNSPPVEEPMKDWRIWRPASLAYTLALLYFTVPVVIFASKRPFAAMAETTDLSAAAATIYRCLVRTSRATHQQSNAPAEQCTSSTSRAQQSNAPAEQRTSRAQQRCETLPISRIRFQRSPLNR